MECFTSLPTLAWIALTIGSAWVTTASLILIYRAFRESLAWGLACIFFPLAVFMFTLRFWRDVKGVFYGYVSGIGCMMIAFGLFLTEPGTRAFVVELFNEHVLFREIEEGDEPEGQPKRRRGKPKGITNLQAEFEAQDKAAAIQEERRQRAAELYSMVQAWHGELAKKQPGPGAKPEELSAFNKEYGNYQGLLSEYKTAVEEFKKSQPMAQPGPKPPPKGK